MKKSWLYILVLSVPIIGYIVWQGYEADRKRHKEYGRIIMEYIDDCPGTRVQEMYIEKGEKVFSIRCEEENEKELTNKIYI
jgi:hypothetical protein